MRGIIFNTQQEFDTWNTNVTNEMKAQGQIMDIWCNAIISIDGTNRYFGITESEGIRRTIIEQFFGSYTETSIESTDPDWFDQTPPIPFPTPEEPVV